MLTIKKYLGDAPHSVQESGRAFFDLGNQPVQVLLATVEKSQLYPDPLITVQIRGSYTSYGASQLPQDVVEWLLLPE